MNDPLIAWMGIEDGGGTNIAKYHLILDDKLWWKAFNVIFELLAEIVKIAGAISAFLVKLLTDTDYVIGPIADLFQKGLNQVYQIVPPYVLLGAAVSVVGIRTYFGYHNKENSGKFAGIGAVDWSDRMRDKEWMDSLMQGLVMVTFAAVILANPMALLKKAIDLASALGQTVQTQGMTENGYGTAMLAMVMQLSNFGDMGNQQCSAQWSQDMNNETKNSLSCMTGSTDMPHLTGMMAVILVVGILLLCMCAYFAVQCFIRGTWFLFMIVWLFFRFPLEALRYAVFDKNLGTINSTKVMADRFKAIFIDMLVYMGFFMLVIFMMASLPTLLLEVIAGGPLARAVGTAPAALLGMVVTGVTLYYVGKWVRFLQPSPKLLQGDDMGISGSEATGWRDFTKAFRESGEAEGKFEFKRLYQDENGKFNVDELGKLTLGSENLTEQLKKLNVIPSSRYGDVLENNQPIDLTSPDQVSDVIKHANRVQGDLSRAEARRNKLLDKMNDEDQEFTTRDGDKLKKLDEEIEKLTGYSSKVEMARAVQQDGKNTELHSLDYWTEEIGEDDEGNPITRLSEMGVDEGAFAQAVGLLGGDDDPEDGVTNSARMVYERGGKKMATVGSVALASVLSQHPELAPESLKGVFGGEMGNQSDTSGQNEDATETDEQEDTKPPSVEDTVHQQPAPSAGKTYAGGPRAHRLDYTPRAAREDSPETKAMVEAEIAAEDAREDEQKGLVPAAEAATLPTTPAGSGEAGADAPTTVLGQPVTQQAENGQQVEEGAGGPQQLSDVVVEQARPAPLVSPQSDPLYEKKYTRAAERLEDASIHLRESTQLLADRIAIRPVELPPHMTPGEEEYVTQGVDHASPMHTAMIHKLDTLNDAVGRNAHRTADPEKLIASAANLTNQARQVMMSENSIPDQEGKQTVVNVRMRPIERVLQSAQAQYAQSEDRSAGDKEIAQVYSMLSAQLHDHRRDVEQDVGRALVDELRRTRLSDLMGEQPVVQQVVKAAEGSNMSSSQIRQEIENARQAVMKKASTNTPNMVYMVYGMGAAQPAVAEDPREPVVPAPAQSGGVASPAVQTDDFSDRTPVIGSLVGTGAAMNRSNGWNEMTGEVENHAVSTAVVDDTEYAPEPGSLEKDPVSGELGSVDHAMDHDRVR